MVPHLAFPARGSGIPCFSCPVFGRTSRIQTTAPLAFLSLLRSHSRSPAPCPTPSPPLRHGWSGVYGWTHLRRLRAPVARRAGAASRQEPALGGASVGGWFDGRARSRAQFIEQLRAHLH